MKTIYKYGLSFDEYNLLENNEIIWFRKHTYRDLKIYAIRNNNTSKLQGPFDTLRTAAIKLGWINES